MCSLPRQGEGDQVDQFQKAGFELPSPSLQRQAESARDLGRATLLA
jgi:hypothetical protein